ncbi:HD domain-containing protein [Aureimonas sp. AU20]|uniref:HD domain-containing protein n=1 Tax=Aureimonas sp. AU20 TaxID=1349819 RepID=UPI00071FED16|nr:HD domain-containing protein [Aureimonas sp. AU20]ALN72775.1 metal dependent phosphohydrolase [Aureimonas sp. AU20]
MKHFEVRDPIHGMISFNELEWDIINSQPFQRLRRIRQLAWTDYVYPGAMHTRFEHSLGVCHVISRLFDSITRKDEDILRGEYNFETEGLKRQRQILRLAALTHDLGHGPFSHAAEDAFPLHQHSDKRWTHEEYSAEIVKQKLADIIDNHPINNNNYNINISQITSLYSGSSNSGSSVVWKDLISGQMDADRMDYLLRDSYHSGVQYGKFDLDRLVSTVKLCVDSNDTTHVLGVEDGGMHAVEGLILARYMMFTQVYFHKTRVAYDYHYDQSFKNVLAETNGVFPSPDTLRGLDAYLGWDDWAIVSRLNDIQGSLHVEALKSRNHVRRVFATPECPEEADRIRFDKAEVALNGLDPVVRDAKKSWYKFQKEEIRLHDSQPGVRRSIPLATRSPVVNGLRTVEEKRLYVPLTSRAEASKRLEKL